MRSRQPTEKGMSYQKELLRSSRNSLCSKIKHQMSAIDLLKEQGGSLEIITSEMENFDSKFDELLEINRRYQQLLTKDEENVDGSWMEDLDREIFQFKSSLNEWKRYVDDDLVQFHNPRIQNNPNKDGSVRQSSCASKGSRGSRSSGRSDASRIRSEEARLAELKVAAEFMKRKQQKERLWMEAELQKRREELELEMKKKSEEEEMKLEEEMEKVRAKLQVYQIDGSESSLNNEMPVQNEMLQQDDIPRQRNV